MILHCGRLRKVKRPSENDKYSIEIEILITVPLSTHTYTPESETLKSLTPEPCNAGLILVFVKCSKTSVAKKVPFEKDFCSGKK